MGSMIQHRGAPNWSKTLANELGPHGITVNNVLPGATSILLDGDDRVVFLAGGEHLGQRGPVAQHHQIGDFPNLHGPNLPFESQHGRWTNGRGT